MITLVLTSHFEIHNRKFKRIEKFDEKQFERIHENS